MEIKVKLSDLQRLPDGEVVLPHLWPMACDGNVHCGFPCTPDLSTSLPQAWHSNQIWNFVAFCNRFLCTSARQQQCERCEDRSVDIAIHTHFTYFHVVLVLVKRLQVKEAVAWQILTAKAHLAHRMRFSFNSLPRGRSYIAKCWSLRGAELPRLITRIDLIDHPFEYWSSGKTSSIIRWLQM